MAPAPRAIPRRELVTLLAYVRAGSHKAAAHRLGISESTSRQRVSQLLRRVGARNAAQAIWRLGDDLEADGFVAPRCWYGDDRQDGRAAPHGCVSSRPDEVVAGPGVVPIEVVVSPLVSRRDRRAGRRSTGGCRPVGNRARGRSRPGW